MKKILKYSWVIIVILIVGGAFYWFQWRPNEIRKKCALESYYPLSLSKQFQSDSEKEQSYKACLRIHGLEK